MDGWVFTECLAAKAAEIRQCCAVRQQSLMQCLDPALSQCEKGRLSCRDIFFLLKLFNLDKKKK